MVRSSVRPRLCLRPETLAAFRICFPLSAIPLGNSFAESGTATGIRIFPIGIRDGDLAVVLEGLKLIVLRCDP